MNFFQSTTFVVISGLFITLIVFSSGGFIRDPYRFIFTNMNIHDKLNTSKINSLDSPSFTNGSNTKRSINHYKPRNFFPGASHAFIQYSAYRTSPSQITVIGLGEASLRNNHSIGLCIWYGNDGKIIRGSFNYGMNGASTLSFEEEIFHCYLRDFTGDKGGYLIGHLNGENRTMYEEEAGKVQNFTEPALWNRTFCSSPLHGQLDGRAIFEWMEYHRVIMGMDYFVFYDISAIDKDFMAHIQPYVDASMVTIVNFTEISQFDVFYFGQVMVNWDCMYSMVFDTQWVFLHDLDEYLNVFPPHSLTSLLKENEDKAWMTIGRTNFEISMCNDHKSNNTFFVERMVFRDYGIYCSQDNAAPLFPVEMCLYWNGLRKLIVNPRKVVKTQVHTVIYALGGEKHFNATSEMRYDHFRSIVIKNGTQKCKHAYSDEEKVISKYRDYTLASQIARVKSFPLKPSHLPST